MNIIWIVTDSARNFSTGGLDDRDRPEFYDELLPEFVNFESAVTSAPSSVMSGACMLTGMNSYYVGRNYDDFRYEEGVFPNLAKIVAEAGYETQSIFVAREMREKIAPFIGHVEKEYWPSEIKHSDRMWSNESANLILENFLRSRQSKEKKQPLFLMLWNNIRHDPNISSNLERIVELLKQYNIFDDSLVIFCADHGYPHPRRGFTPENLKRQGLTHDLMLSDDNILIPLLIRAPDAVPRSLKEQVGTIDLFPTVLDYAGIQEYPRMDNYPLSGLSLRSLISGKVEPRDKQFDERIIRCDCRFFGQSGRKTAIRLNEFKYVYSHDEGNEEFFDISFDDTEDHNLIDKEQYTAIVNKLRASFKLEEELAERFQREYAARKITKRLEKHAGAKHVQIVSEHEYQFNQMLKESIETSDKIKYKLIEYSASKSPNASEIQSPNLDRSMSNNYFVLITLSSSSSQHAIVAKENGINKFDLILDINLDEVASKASKFNKFVRALRSRRKLIMAEPLLLYTYSKEALARLLAKFQKRLSNQ